jgi:cysteine dioxygenase
MSIENFIEEIKNVKNFPDVKNILNNYTADDWKKFVKINNCKYHKEKIFENDYLDVYILTWNKKQQSKIHNHAKNGCWLKMLQGGLIENIYDKDLNLQNKNILNSGDIGFMHDDLGYHDIINDNDYIAVSLHVYSPPRHFTKYF